MDFIMLGAIVNFIAVICGSFIGLLFKKGIPERISETIMRGMGLCVLFIGVSGTFDETAALDGTKRAIVMIFSILFGALTGELIDLDKQVERAGKWIEKKIGTGHGNITEGFVSATLLFCVGAMSVLGPLQSGLDCDHTTQLTKSVIDCVCSVIYASSMGIGVAFSAFSVLFLQGGITLLSGWIAPVLSESVVAQMSVVGSLLIIGLSLNVLGITKLKIMNYLPAVFFAIPFSLLYDIVISL
ncbi:MAG: DUF554 domain-containing protein [Clostridia bacterium]|nr:DUF554 domain-containing protein [Clostridia bacterium]